MDMHPIHRSEYKYNKNGRFELLRATHSVSVKSNPDSVFMVIWINNNTREITTNTEILVFQPIKRSRTVELKINTTPATITKEY
jgi:hypothetical protein